MIRHIDNIILLLPTDIKKMEVNERGVITSLVMKRKYGENKREIYRLTETKVKAKKKVRSYKSKSMNWLDKR